ncbi:MAG: hypothetical protein IKX45_07245 [Bacteroidales bacterium]|nr:hypothetical protein [Bacteroidales bacterium]
MIEKMTKYSFVLLNAGKEDFLSQLQALGLVDITRSERPVDERTSALLGKVEAQKKLIGEIETGRNATVKELEDKLTPLRKEEESIRVWGDWDREALAETGVKLHFYSIPAKKYDPDWDKAYVIVKADEGSKNIHFVIAGDNAGFPLKEMREPERPLSEVQAEIKGLEDELKEAKATLVARKEDLPRMREDLARLEGDLSRALASAAAEDAAENTLAVFEGFSPVENDSALEKSLNAMDVLWFKDAATMEDNPPIAFRNNKFVKMFELLTDMYGRPAYNGFDPTPFIAIFFMLFFAFCMGDAGYGLLLIALGFGLKKVLGDISPLVITLGVATTVIGFLFHTFFSMDIAQWQVFEPIKGIFLPSKIMGYDGTMVLSLIVGVVHLSLAMIIKTIMATKQKGFVNSLGTWGWTLLVVGGAAIGTFALLGVIDKGVTKIAIITVGVLSALGIFILNDPHRNVFANIGSGLWETYNGITGLLGDVLSYLRLYALGLAGAMLGKAFNDIGLMVLGDGRNIAMWVFFIIIILLGHTLNIAMAALGAFVHPLRLNFLEFFKNSGYEATGRNFNPLK